VLSRLSNPGTLVADDRESAARAGVAEASGAIARADADFRILTNAIASLWSAAGLRGTTTSTDAGLLLPTEAGEVPRRRQAVEIGEIRQLESPAAHFCNHER
jgi:hypothetical protein